MTKKIQLRAFSISEVKQSITKQGDDIRKLLNNVLNKTTVEQRILLLNNDDPNKISDILSFFEESDGILLGTIMRISNTDKIQEITQNLMSGKKFDILEMKNSKSKDGVAIYQSHYYFALNNQYLVTNLPMTTTISRLQTYINWLIKKSFEFTPVIDNVPQLNLQDLKRLSISDSLYSDKDNVLQKKLNISKYIKQIVSNLLIDVKGLSEIEKNRIISAELLLKFVKPKNMSSEKYKKIMGKMLKPISDLENVTFTSNNNKKFSADKLVKTKSVDVEKIENSNLISEADLFDNMKKFILEL